MKPFQQLFAVCTLFVSASVGCGGGELLPSRFSTDWTDDGGKSIAEVRTKLRAAVPPKGADVAVAVVGHSGEIAGLPLGGGAKWSFKHALDARPVIAGPLVVGMGGGEVFALDAQTGAKVWTLSVGSVPFYGAGDDGKTTVVTVGRAPSGSTLLAIARNGGVKQQIETSQVLGVPAALSGYAFVPWGNQYISAINIETGNEEGRATVRGKVSRAWTEGGALFFGELGIVRFDDHIAEASRGKASSIELPARELPGTPRLMFDGTARLGPYSNAFDRTRLYARPSPPDGPLVIDAGRYYATYFKLVFGFESTKGTLTWVHTHASEVLGGEAVQNGVVLCDTQGKVTTLDARTGAVTATMDFGSPIESCVVGADTHRAGPPITQTKPLADQISDAVLNKDDTLATAQRLLLRELSTLSDEAATKTLVEIAGDDRASPLLIADARTFVAARRNGARFMLESLKRHYDYLADVLRSPPVGPLAQALAAMNEKAAAPLLASHLLDPADSDDDVKQAAIALVALGTPAEAPALKQFFTLYRAGAANDEVALAVSSAGEALLNIDAKTYRPLLDRATSDTTTVQVVHDRLEAIEQAYDAKQGASKDAGAP